MRTVPFFSLDDEQTPLCLRTVLFPSLYNKRTPLSVPIRFHGAFVQGQFNMVSLLGPALVSARFLLFESSVSREDIQKLIFAHRDKPIIDALRVILSASVFVSVRAS